MKHYCTNSAFQDIESFEPKAGGGEEKQRMSWGVRKPSLVNTHSQQPALRPANPTEDKIAREIRELKEREEELVRLRDSPAPAPASAPETAQLTPPPAAKPADPNR